jgi:hypothetical protein
MGVEFRIRWAIAARRGRHGATGYYLSRYRPIRRFGAEARVVATNWTEEKKTPEAVQALYDRIEAERAKGFNKDPKAIEKIESELNAAIEKAHQYGERPPQSEPKPSAPEPSKKTSALPRSGRCHSRISPLWVP